MPARAFRQRSSLRYQSPISPGILYVRLGEKALTLPGDDCHLDLERNAEDDCHHRLGTAVPLTSLQPCRGEKPQLCRAQGRRDQDDPISADEKHVNLTLRRLDDLFVRLCVDVVRGDCLLHVPENHVKVLIKGLHPRTTLGQHVSPPYRGQAHRSMLT